MSGQMLPQTKTPGELKALQRKLDAMTPEKREEWENDQKAEVERRAAHNAKQQRFMRFMNERRPKAIHFTPYTHYVLTMVYLSEIKLAPNLRHLTDFQVYHAYCSSNLIFSPIKSLTPRYDAESGKEGICHPDTPVALRTKYPVGWLAKIEKAAAYADLMIFIAQYFVQDVVDDPQSVIEKLYRISPFTPREVVQRAVARSAELRIAHHQARENERVLESGLIQVETKHETNELTADQLQAAFDAGQALADEVRAEDPELAEQLLEQADGVIEATPHPDSVGLGRGLAGGLLIMDESAYQNAPSSEQAEESVSSPVGVESRPVSWGDGLSPPAHFPPADPETGPFALPQEARSSATWSEQAQGEEILPKLAD